MGGDEFFDFLIFFASLVGIYFQALIGIFLADFFDLLIEMLIVKAVNIDYDITVYFKIVQIIADVQTTHKPLEKTVDIESHALIDGRKPFLLAIK